MWDMLPKRKLISRFRLARGQSVWGKSIRRGIVKREIVWGQKDNKETQSGGKSGRRVEEGKCNAVRLVIW